MTSRTLGLAGVVVVLAGCGAGEPRVAETHRDPAATSPPLRIRELRASVVRLGSTQGQPLLGVRLRADTCVRAEAEVYPRWFRIDHYVTRRPRAKSWGRPFRVLSNDMYWIVPFSEARGACGEIVFEDVLPPENYGGAESALGHLRGQCYGVQLTLRALHQRPDDKPLAVFSAGRRAIVQCARFGPR